jgi:hypothetical protein
MAIEKVTRCIQMASISGVPSISGNLGAIDWGNIFGKLVDTGANLIQQNNQPSSGGYQYTMQQPTASTGISTNTLLLVGAAGLGLYLIFRKK